MAAYNPETTEMVRPAVDWRLPNGSRREIYADRGLRSNDCWVFLNVRQLIHPAPTDPATAGPISPNLILRSQTNVLVIDEFSETPEQIRSEIKIRGLDSIRAAKRPQLSIQTILDYLSLNPHPLPGLRAMLETQLHVRLAAPWTCIVVVLIALPFGAASGRRNVFVGVASSIFICFGYFVLQRVGLALGVGGLIPGWLAGWLPNLVFAAAGIWLTSSVR
jgi:lipopolysaccharide export LptBFGC system permease protein LptF